MSFLLLLILLELWSIGSKLTPPAPVVTPEFPPIDWSKEPRRKRQTKAEQEATFREMAMRHCIPQDPHAGQRICLRPDGSSYRF
jgi:hypothetical protein